MAANRTPRRGGRRPPHRPDQEVVDSLLKTLRHAAQAPYYRRTWGRRWQRVRSLADLEALPILDKPTAIANQEELVVGQRPPGLGVVSSGTTRADVDLRPLHILRGAAEQRAVAELRLKMRPQRGAQLFPGWTLVVKAVTHGLPLGIGPGEIVAPWMHDRNALHMIEGLLERPQPDGYSVSALRISTGALKVFTAWMLEHGRDPRWFAVRLIGTNSFRLSPFWRALIAERFNARIFDNYSLSELATPATECSACGYLHFRAPPLVFEVLDLKSGRQRRSGVGRLVLTGLYPYVQTMPLVRYDTGDAVELGPCCPVTGEPGLRLLGRVRRGLVVDGPAGGAFVLAPTAVQDVLEGLVETERTPHPCQKLGLIGSVDVGLPRWTVELSPAQPKERPVARLAFEVRFDPLVFAARARELEQRVSAALLAADEQLGTLTRRRVLRFAVRAARAGSLCPPPDKYD